MSCDRGVKYVLRPDTPDLDVARRQLRIDRAEGDLRIREEVAVFHARFECAQADVLTVPVEADGVGRYQAVLMAARADRGQQSGLQDTDMGVWNRCLGQLGGRHAHSLLLVLLRKDSKTHRSRHPRASATNRPAPQWAA